MFRMNFMVWSALILIIQSGCIGGKKNPTPIPIPPPPIEIVNPPIKVITKVGIGLERGKIEKYPKRIEGSYYYGQVVIEPSLTMEALKGPEAQTFLDHVSNLLGEKKRNFGLSVTPIIDGKVQPDIVLFNYAYDSSNKTWVTYLNEEPRTRMVLLKSNTNLSFELKYISIDGKTFNMVKNITKDIYGGTILLGGASIPYIDLISEKVSNMLSSAVSSTTVLSFNPISTAKKSVEYTIKTKTDKKLATVKFSLLLRDSVVSGAVVDSELNKIPQVNNFTNPLNAVYTSYTNAFTLNDQLQKDESITSFSQINNPTYFRDKCQNIINRLETYGLNIFDRYNAFSQILEGTNFLQNHSLFHSGCLSKRKLGLLEKMGIPLIAPPSPIAPHVEISDSSLTNLGRYMLNPIANVGFKSELLRLFSNTLIVQGDELMNFEGFRSEDGEAVMSPEKLMEELAKIGVARFGMYNSQRKEFARFFFRPLQSETIYRIKLNREKSWGSIRTVLIEPWQDDDIPRTKQKELRTPADITVLAHETDILRKDNGTALALNN
jgi:hypothetical protein